MGRKARVYKKVEEADEMIKGLCENQPEFMWCIKQPDNIIVMGIENVERSEKNKTLAKIKPIKGAEKAIFQVHNIPVRYLIEVFWSDWNAWTMRQKQWIIFHELLHVHPDYERLIKHDCEDWKAILDSVGVNWFDKKDGLPDLMDKGTKLNTKLMPSLDLNDEESDEIPDGKDNEEKEEKEDADGSKHDL